MKQNRKDNRMNITKNDALNILDALNEWYDIIEPKELAENEIGLNSERYENIIKKLKQLTKQKGQ